MELVDNLLELVLGYLVDPHVKWLRDPHAVLRLRFFGQRMSLRRTHQKITGRNADQFHANGIGN